MGTSGQHFHVPTHVTVIGNTGFASTRVSFAKLNYVPVSRGWRMGGDLGNSSSSNGGPRRRVAYTSSPAGHFLNEEGSLGPKDAASPDAVFQFPMSRPNKTKGQKQNKPQLNFASFGWG